MATSAQSQSQQQTSTSAASAAQLQLLVVVVEGTAAQGPSWPSLRSEYVDKITKAFCVQDGSCQSEMALVVLGSHGPYSGCLVQRSGWTSNLELFNQWLSAIDFSGGGFGEVAVAEGLAEALVMSCPATQPPSTQPVQRHCLLVAASNPYKLQTPVPHPCLSIGNDTQTDRWWLADAETVAKAFPQCHVSLSVICPRQLPSLKSIFAAAKKNNRAADPSTDAVKHSQYLVLISESFVEAKSCLRRSSTAAVTSASVAALPPTVKVEQQATAPVPTTTSPLNQTTSATATAAVSAAAPAVVAPGRPPQVISNGNIPTSAVKIEHGFTTGTISYSSSSMLNSTMAAAVPLPMQTSAATSVSTLGQDVTRPPLSTETTTVTQDFKNIPPPNPMQSHRPVAAASVLNAYSQIRHSSGPLNLGPNSSAMSSILSAGVGSGQGALGITQPVSTGMSHGLSGESGMGAVQGNATSNTMLPAAVPGITQAGGILNSLPSSTVGLGQSMQATNALGGVPMAQSGLGVPHMTLPVAGSAGMVTMTQPGQNPVVNTPGVATPPQTNAKYTRLWQGTLAGQRQGKPVAICNLEAYRQISSSETLAADWPQTMQIVRLISQDFMSREYQGKAELLVFRPMAHHGFLSQLAEKKLCAVIQLPSQTLLLASADKPQRMIGMLFPGDMVVFKPQPSSQQQQQQQQGGGAFPSASFPQAPGQLAGGQQNKPQMMSIPGAGSQMPGSAFLP